MDEGGEPTSPSEGDVNPREGRRRNLLKAFYGIGQDNNASSSADPSNINGSNFDPNQYFEGILRTHNLKSLMQKDNEMVAEIKKLDSDMKTLVYENYNKFISATETIRKMKDNVQNMEEEMNSLSSNMEKITTCSDQINNTLAVRRDKIEQLTGVHRLLKKLQFLVELPSRLRKSIELEAHSQAVKYYSIATVILKKYSNLPSFVSIQKECETIIDGLKQTLRKKVEDSKLPSAQVTEPVSLLLELYEPPEKLGTQYLNGRKSYMEGLLESFTASKYANDAEKAVVALDKLFLFDFLESCKTFKLLFIVREDIDQSVRENSKKYLEKIAKELFMKYFTIARTVLSSSEVSNLILGLDILNADLKTAHSHLPELGIEDKTNDMITTIVQSSIEQSFTNLQSMVRGYIQALGNGKEVKSLSITKQTNRKIIEAAEISLLKLKLFFLPTERSTNFLAKHSIAFIAKIHVKVQQFFLFTNVVILEFIEDPKTTLDAQELRFLLLLARLSHYLASDVVDQVAEILSQFVKEVSNMTNQDTPMEFSISAPDLQQRFKQSADRLLLHFVKLHSQKLAQMMWKAMDTPNWITMKEPKAPRSVVELLLDEIKALSVEFGQAFDQKEDDSLVMLKRINPRDPRRGTDRNAVIFDRKLQFYNDVEFNRNSILAMIIKLFLKSFLEFVRMKTFSRNGFNQIQLDVYFTRAVLCNLVQMEKGAEQIINLLMDEVLINTMERCFDPIPYEQDTILEYCGAKLKKALGQSNPSSPTSATSPPSNPIVSPQSPQQSTTTKQ